MLTAEGIFRSVRRGNIREINGTAVETEDDCGYTPLHLATESGTLEIIKFLLNHGAVLEAKNKYGDTPF